MIGALRIDSLHNPRVKAWAKLAERKWRDVEGRYVVEGIRLVREALASGACVETIVATARWAGDGALRSQAEAAGAEWVEVSDRVMDKLAVTETPQGIAAVVRKRAATPEAWLSDSVSVVVVADGLQDPGNLGAIVRSVDAAGATGVLVGPDTVDPYNPKAVRAAMGSLFRVPVVAADPAVWLPKARASGIRIVGLSPRAESSIYEADIAEKVWFIVGSEGRGVSERAASLADLSVRIPMAGAAESLNAAMAATVVLFESLRRRLFFR